MRRLFKDNGLGSIELAWWDGATTFKETFTAEDSMTPTLLPWISKTSTARTTDPGSAEKAVAAYEDGCDGDRHVTTTDDENDDEDEEEREDKRRQVRLGWWCTGWL